MSAPHHEQSKSSHATPANFESLLASVNGIVWEADIRTLCFTYVSPKAEEILGYPLDDWLDDPNFWADHIHPDDREETVSYCMAATAEGVGHEIEYRMFAADGSVVWLHDVVTVVNDENGKPARLRGVMVDITRQKRKVQQATAMKDAVLQAIPAHIMVLDRQGVIVSVHADGEPPRCRGRFPGFDLPVGSSYEQMCKAAMTQGCVHAEQALAGVNDVRFGRREQFDLEYGIDGPDGPRWYRMIVTSLNGREADGPAGGARERDGAADGEAQHHDATGHFGGGVLITHFSITKRMQVEQALRRRAAIESLVVSVSTELRAATAEELDGAIDRTLEAIGRFTGADRCHLVRVGLARDLNDDADGGLTTRSADAGAAHVADPRWRDDAVDADTEIIRNTHEWCADGVAPHKADVQNLPTSRIPWWMQQLERRQFIHIPDVRDMPPEAAVEQQILQSMSLRSAVGVPLMFDSRVVGFVGLNAVRQPRTWNDDELRLLGTIGEIIINVMERRRAATRLAQREAQYRMLTECTRDMISLHDTDGRFIYANPVSRTYIGVEPSDLVGRNIYDFIHAEDRQRLREAHERSHFGQPSFVSWRLMHPDGSILWVESNLSVIHDDDNRPYAVVCTSRDITARIRAELALRESEQRFATVFNASTVGILITDLEDGCVIDLNDAMLEIVERRREDVIGRSTVELGIWPSRDDRASMVRTIRERQSIRDLDHTIRTPSGRVKYTLSSLETVTLEGHDCIISIVHEVTDRRRAERALRASEQRFHAFMEMNPAAAWIKDSDGRYVYVNKTLEVVYKVRSQDVLGRTDEDLLGPEVGAVLRRNDQRVLSTGRAVELVEEIPNPDGRIHSWMILKFPLPAAGPEALEDDGSSAPLVGGLALDITERLGHERGLRRNALMQQAVAELGLLVARLPGQFPGRDSHAVKVMAEQEIDRLLQAAVERLASTLGVPFASVYELNVEDAALHHRSGFGWRVAAEPNNTVRVDSPSPTARTLAQAEPLVIENIKQRDDIEPGAWLAAHNVVASLTVIVHGQRRATDGDASPFGVLGVYSDAPRRLTRDELNFVQTVANILSTGIDRCRAAAERQVLIRDLRERIKELSLLHQTWRHFQDRTLSIDDLMQRIVRMMAGAWMYAESAAARITVDDRVYTTDNWRVTPWMQQAAVHTNDGRPICVELAYLREYPAEFEGPFLAEERALIDTLAETIRTHLETRHAEESLRRSERQFKALVEHTPDAITRIDRDYRLEYVSPGVKRLTGVDPEAMVGRSVDDLDLPVDLRRQFKRALRRVFETRRETVIDLELPAPPTVVPNPAEPGASPSDESASNPNRGATMSVEARVVPEFGDDGTVESVLSIARDITDRKKAEEDLRRSAELQRLMLSELDHRVRNNLAALAALIDITARDPMDVPTFAASIKGRVQAMATVHSLLSRGHWRAVGLRALVTAIVPDDLASKVHLTGPEVQMAPQQVTAMGMVFQELIANSLKYGALKAAGGRVMLEWSVRTPPDEPGITLELKWREQGGPTITTKPRPGLGTGLIRGFVRAELRGEATFAYPEEGAFHTFVMRLESVDG